MDALLAHVARHETLDRALADELRASPDIARRLLVGIKRSARAIDWLAPIGSILAAIPFYQAAVAQNAQLAFGTLAVAFVVLVPIGFLFERRIERWSNALLTLDGPQALSTQIELLSLKRGRQILISDADSRTIARLEQVDHLDSEDEKALNALLWWCWTPRGISENNAELGAAIVRYAVRSGSPEFEPMLKQIRDANRITDRHREIQAQLRP